MFIHRRVGWPKEPPNDALVFTWIVQVRPFLAVEKKVFFFRKSEYKENTKRCRKH